MWQHVWSYTSQLQRDEARRLRLDGACGGFLGGPLEPRGLLGKSCGLPNGIRPGLPGGARGFREAWPREGNPDAVWGTGRGAREGRTKSQCVNVTMYRSH